MTAENRPWGLPRQLGASEKGLGKPQEPDFTGSETAGRDGRGRPGSHPKSPGRTHRFREAVTDTARQGRFTPAAGLAPHSSHLTRLRSPHVSGSHQGGRSRPRPTASRDGRGRAWAVGEVLSLECSRSKFFCFIQMGGWTDRRDCWAGNEQLSFGERDLKGRFKYR